MRPLLGILFCHLALGSLAGCSFFGYYKYKRAERAPAEESSNIKFPNSYEAGIHLDGPAMAALEVARNEFLPLHARGISHSREMANCIARRDMYDVTVLKANDNLYFVSFLPRLERCGIVPDVPVVDLGRVYAIDGAGRILDEL